MNLHNGSGITDDNIGYHVSPPLSVLPLTHLILDMQRVLQHNTAAGMFGCATEIIVHNLLYIYRWFHYTIDWAEGEGRAH